MGYRDAPRELPPRARDVHWRIAVARAAQLSFWALMAQAWLGTWAHVIASGIVTWLCWQLSAPRPVTETRERAGLRWTLRGLSVVALALEALGRWGYALGGHITVRYVTGSNDLTLTTLVNTLLAAAGLLYVRELFREFEVTDAAEHAKLLTKRYVSRVSAMYGAIAAMGVFTWVGKGEGWATIVQIPFLIAMVVAFFGQLKVGFDVLKLLRRLRRTLRVTAHEWWFKPGIGWASLAVSEGGAEVIETTGERALFADRDAAIRWFGERDYLSQAQAIAEGAVLGAPPPIVVQQRSPKVRARVAIDETAPAPNDSTGVSESDLDGAEDSSAPVERVERTATRSD